LYLFFATLPCDILSGFLVFSERVAYPVYLSNPGQSSLSVLADQQFAGALMWTCVTVVYLVAGAILSTYLLSPQISATPEIDPQSIEVPLQAWPLTAFLRRSMSGVWCDDTNSDYVADCLTGKRTDPRIDPKKNLTSTGIPTD
jgi:hypothetical protein